MSIALVLLMAVVSVSSALVLLCRVVGMRWVLKRATFIDVGFAIFAGIALHSSIIGIMIAILGGLVMALVLQAGRMVMRMRDAVSGALKCKTKRNPHDDNWAPKYGWEEL